MNINDLKNKDLKDWTLTDAYLMEVYHGSMGCYPVIKVTTKEIVISTNREHFRTIWSKLPRTRVNIRKITVFIDKDQRSVVHATNEKADSKNFFLITEEKLDECIKDGQFAYAPGIISLIDESRATFPEEGTHRQACIKACFFGTEAKIL